MRLNHFTAAVVASITVAITSLGQETNHTAWMIDFDAAKQKAAAEGKDLLINFSGSDWCSACKRLDAEVFTQAAFIKKASEKFVLVLLDFPRGKEAKAKIPKALRKRNQELMKEFGVTGFPTVFLADASGTPYEQTGYFYGAGVPGAYFEHLNELATETKRRKELLAKANAPDLPDSERAKLLYEALSSMSLEEATTTYRKEMEKVIELDPENAEGVRNECAARLAVVDAKAAMQSNDYVGAIKIYEDMITKTELSGQLLQTVLYKKGALYFHLNDGPGLRATLDRALAASPDGKQVERIAKKIKLYFPEGGDKLFKNGSPKPEEDVGKDK